MSSTMVTTMAEMTDVLNWEIQNLNKCLNFYPHSASGETYLGSITSNPMEVAKESYFHSKWTFKLASKKNELGVDQLTLGVHLYNLYGQSPGVFHEEGADFVLCAYDISLASGMGQNPFAMATRLRYHHMLDWGSDEYGDLFEEYFLFTNIMPLRDFVTKQSELCPENKLVIKIAFTCIFDAQHTTLPNLNSEDTISRQSMDSLVKSFGRMWTDESFSKFSDFKITCGDPTVMFNVHKNILAARSPFFETYFADRWTNSSTNPQEYQVEDCEPETFESLLKFIYTGELEIPEATEKEALLSLIYAAEKYGLTELKVACFYRMFTNITDENAGEFAVAAYNYRADADSAKLIRDYCARRHEHLIQEPKYKELYKNKPAAFLGD